MGKRLLSGVGYKAIFKYKDVSPKFLSSRESKGTTEEALVMRVDEQP